MKMVDVLNARTLVLTVQTMDIVPLVMGMMSSLMETVITLRSLDVRRSMAMMVLSVINVGMNIVCLLIDEHVLTAQWSVDVMNVES